MQAFKIAPAARWWMHLYNVVAKEVAATGPKGYITKGDVLMHIEKNNLPKGIQEVQAAKPKKAAAKTQPAANINDPFAQTWVDHGCDDFFKQAAENMHVAKRYTAHSYISSKCDVTAIQEQIKMINGMVDTPVKYESFLLKAASAAFARTFESIGDTNVARIVSEVDVDEASGVKFFQRANELQVSQFATGDLTEGTNGFANGAPLSQCGLTVTHVDRAMSSFPLVNNTAFISLHYSDPATEVLPAGAVAGETFDIEEFDDEHLDYSSGLKVAQTATVSIAYDVQRVDDQKAAEFMKHLKMCLDDPDTLLL